MHKKIPVLLLPT